MPSDNAAQPKSRPPRLTRRAFLTRGCLGGLAASALGTAYARYVEPFWPVLERVPMDLPRLDPALEGLRLIQLSDLHISSRRSADYLRDQFRRCQELTPDLVVLTGDFITHGDRRWSDEFAALLSVLRAPLGVFAVLGNHDYGVYSPARVPRGQGIADRVCQVLVRCGVTVLRNESRVLTTGGAPLQLAGLDDLWGGFCDPDQAFADVDPETPTITLAHNPDAVDCLRDKPCDWILCGHTHGGQVRIPFYGAPILPVRNRQYDAGLFDVAGKRLYVNRGLGYLRQVRFNCRPEITEFTLVRRA